MIEKKRVEKHVVGTLQYERVTEDARVAILKEAKELGTLPELERYIEIIEGSLGRNSLTYGHIYWIWESIEKGIKAEGQTQIPRFTKPFIIGV